MVNTIKIIKETNPEIVLTEKLTYFELKLNYLNNAIEFKMDNKAVLDNLIAFLKEHPKKELEVISHCDANGEFDYNMELSLQRAIYVKGYLDKATDNKNKITATSKGELEIRNRCKDGIQCSDEEHSYNRRTEFNIR